MNTVVIIAAVAIGATWTTVSVVLGVIVGKAIALAEARRNRP